MMKKRMFVIAVVVLLFTFQLKAQNLGNISGLVTNNEGKPLTGVNVVVQGGNYGSSTDGNGEYRITNLKYGEKELVFTAIGFASQRIRVEITNKEETVHTIKMELAYSELDEVVITGDAYGDKYLTNSTTVGTKLPIHPKELPIGLNVLSNYMLDQMNPVRITEAIQYISGINQETGFGGRTDIYVIRGFRSERESIFKNGFRNPMRVYRESSNIQQIEILKGPASALYGVSDPGGSINIATKRPKSVKHGEVEFYTNSFGKVRPSIDMGGPINNNERMNYRLNVAYEMGGTYRDQINTEHYFIAPTITYQLNPKTTINVNGEYLKHGQATDRGIPIYDAARDVKYSFDSNKSFGDPYNYTTNKNSLTQAEVVHKISPALSVRSAVNFLHTTGAREAVEISGFIAADTVKRYYQNQRHTEDYNAWQNELLGTFRTGNVKHNGVLGMEISQTGTQMFIQRDKNYDIVSVYETDYNQLPPKILDLSTSHNYDYQVVNYGFYLQDFISVNKYLNLIAGFRYDLYKSEYNNQLKNSKTKANLNHFSPRAGVLVKATDKISVFSNYAQGFNPLWGNPADKNGDAFEPIKNKSIDAGVKMYFMANRFNITATYFDLTRKGMLVGDPNDPDFQIQTGEAKSNGVELDFQGEPLPGWTFMTSYSYTNARISEDTNLDKVGQPLENVAPHMYKLWMNYELQSTVLKGFGFGAGFHNISERASDDGIDVLMLEAYSVIDARLFYRTENWTTSLTINNLTNEKYVLGSQNYNRAMPGAPQHFSLSFNYKF